MSSARQGDSRWGRLAVLVVAVAAVAVLARREDPPPEKPVVRLSAKQRQGCAAAIVQAARSGLVRERPAANRVNVDDGKWRLLPASEKAALLALVACDAFGLAPGELAFSQHTVAYGWRSGKRVAMLTQVGTAFE